MAALLFTGILRADSRGQLWGSLENQRGVKTSDLRAIFEKLGIDDFVIQCVGTDQDELTIWRLESKLDLSLCFKNGNSEYIQVQKLFRERFPDQVSPFINIDRHWE